MNLDAARHAESPPEAPSIGVAEFPKIDCEAALAKIWCEVLHLSGVGRDDHFFALGGHSLHATQVVSRVRALWRVELPLSAFFESPRLHALAARIELLQPASAMATAAPPLGRVARDAALQTSYSQRRMWLVQQLNPQTAAYNMAFTLRLRGPLDARLLAVSLDLVARRHEAFRTRFIAIDGEPMQLVDEHPAVPLTPVDLRGLPGERREAEAGRVLRSLATQPFDLALAGLHRTALLQLDNTDHVLLWLIHHTIGDQWSAGLVMHELQQVYTALVRDEPLRWPHRTLEFADFAEWQRDDVAHQASLNVQRAFWQDRLKGLKPLVLPTDKPRRGMIGGGGGTVSLDLGRARIDALKQFGIRHGATPFMVLLACFDALLARYSGQSDIAVGVPVANRLSLESESVVGTLVNTVVMRTEVSNELGFVQLLERVKATALKAYAHQDAPFNTLVQDLAGLRERNFSPLVQVMFNVLNAPYRVEGFEGLITEAFAFDQGCAQFDLSLAVDTEIFGQIHLEYSTDLFEAASAHRLLSGYVALLDQFLDNPALTVRDCELVCAAQRAELDRWNATQVPFETGVRLGDLIRRQVTLNGAATAVRFEGRHLSYHELDAAARALALRLRALGAGPGALVGVCLERGIELVTALVGVVYSGAAFVPLDPSYPAERLARMCQDASMALLVGRDDELRRLGLAPAGGMTVVDIDAPGGAQADPASRDFKLIGHADDPAYVIFTSGSTGRPKGAMNAHKGVVNWLQWMQAQYHLTPRDRVLLKTPYSFDVSLREFFWPLMTGAMIVVARPDGHRDSAYLVELIRREHITLLHFVPSMLRIFLDEPGLERCTSVRRVVCSGEALPVDAVELFFERMPQSRLCNLYGPTEAAVEVTHWECQPGDACGIVPIGRPVANTQMHVLDSQMRPQPIGVTGDLYIGGVQVGMGYVARPDLSAERFIADPFNPGARLYKTGDLARWLNSGVIDYQGRADDQVKIRGHRIELGEIEIHLATHPEVARCVVTVREDAPGDRRLVAYVVPHAAMPSLEALRQHLRQRLPDAMVPQHFVSLASIPLLTNGKIDRSALAPPTDAALVRNGALLLPRSAAEMALAAVWQRLLGVENISVSDNFFDLGGHSLLALRAVSEIHRTLALRLDVRRLVFESLGQLAASIATQAGVCSEPEAAPADKINTAQHLASGLKRILVGRSSRVQKLS